jgi:hypothetical protein
VPSYQKLLEILKPKTLQEWGPGKNTDMALEAGWHVRSTESEPQYLHSHHPELVQKYVAVESEQYVQPKSSFVYFVDGRRRADCLKHIWPLTDGDKAVILHDVKRERYWQEFAHYDYVVIPDGTTGYATKQGSMCLLFIRAFMAWAPWREYAEWKEIPVAEQRP